MYRTEAGKFRAVVRDIIAAHEKGQTGTGWHGYNRKNPKTLSKLLKMEGVNASGAECKISCTGREIAPSAQAGQKGRSYDLRTTCAGRGTDNKLGEGDAERVA